MNRRSRRYATAARSVLFGSYAILTAAVVVWGWWELSTPHPHPKCADACVLDTVRLIAEVVAGAWIVLAVGVGTGAHRLNRRLAAGPQRSAFHLGTGSAIAGLAIGLAVVAVPAAVIIVDTMIH
jgi:hypothetical protein